MSKLNAKLDLIASNSGKLRMSLRDIKELKNDDWEVKFEVDEMIHYLNTLDNCLLKFGNRLRSTAEEIPVNSEVGIG